MTCSQRTHVNCIAIVLAALITVPVAAQLPCAYEIDTVVGPPCGNNLASVFAHGINEQGDLCGAFACPGSLDQAFVAWNAAGLVPLTFTPQTFESRATDIEGACVVGYFRSTTEAAGFLREGSVFTTISSLPGGNGVEVASVNAARVIVGSWGNTVTGPFPLAFRWENGVMQDISRDLIPGLSRAICINQNGSITGYMGLTMTPSDAHAFVWSNGHTTDLGLMPGSVGTEGCGINNKNQVCGIAWFIHDKAPGFKRRGFFWENGVFTDLGLLAGSDELFPRAINDDGIVVGWRSSSGGGFVWKAGVLRDIDELVRAAPGTIGLLRDINNAGQIAATQFVDPPGLGSPYEVAIRLRPIPREPGDTNCDTFVNVADLLAVIVNWHQHGVDADVNGSGFVDVDDLLMVILNWG